MIEESALDMYASRDMSLADLNLCQFVTSYHTARGKVTRRSTPVIVRTIPSFSSNPQSQLYSEYCKYQLIKYKLWMTIPSNARQREGEEDSDLVAV